MKIWNSYGSEHSANLVLIGHFKDAGTAEDVQAAIDEATEFFSNTEYDPNADRFSEEAMNLLKRIKSYSVSPADLAEFHNSFHMKREGSKIVVTSDDEITVVMKLLLDNGARIEIYSAHDHPDTPHGRGE